MHWTQEASGPTTKPKGQTLKTQRTKLLKHNGQGTKDQIKPGAQGPT